MGDAFLCSDGAIVAPRTSSCSTLTSSPEALPTSVADRHSELVTKEGPRNSAQPSLHSLVCLAPNWAGLKTHKESGLILTEAAAVLSFFPTAHQEATQKHNQAAVAVKRTCFRTIHCVHQGCVTVWVTGRPTYMLGAESIQCTPDYWLFSAHLPSCVLEV